MVYKVGQPPESLWQTTYDAASDAICLLDLHCRVLQCNEAAKYLLEKPISEIIGKTCWEVFQGMPNPCEDCPVDKMKKSHKNESLIVPIKDKWFNVTANPLFGENGELSGCIHIVRDFTERKKMEEDLARILENVPVPTFVIDKDHRVRYWNKACEEITGYSKDDVIGTNGHWKPFFSKPKPLLADVVLDGVEDFYKKKKVRKRKIKEVKDQEDTYELELFLPGFGRWVYFRASLLKVNNEVIGAVETMEDVSERRLMEEIVKAAEQEKGAVLDSMNEVVIFQNLNHRVLLANRAAGKAVGMDPNALVGDSCYEVWFNRSEPCENCPIEKAYKTGKPQEAELAYGGNVWFIRGYPVKDEDGKIGGIVEVGLDITERQKAADKLKEREELYRNLVERANDSIAIIQDGLLKYVNPLLAEVSGYTMEELIDSPFVNYFHPDEAPKVFDRYERRMAGEDVPSIYETIVRNKDGEKVFVELNAGLTTYQGKPADLVIMRDITERKRVEEKLRRQLMKFKLQDGKIYLVKEARSALSLEALKDIMKVGYKSLIISRTSKEEFKKHIKDNFDFLWMGEIGGKKAESLQAKDIEEKVGSLPRKSTILIDRLDYLVFKMGFKKTISFVQRLKDISYFNELVIILSINPETLSEKQLKLLEMETNELETQYVVKLSEDLLEVLRYIYRKNNTGVKPIYTDICNDLGISKPTVMNRIRQLVSKGYLISNTKGRCKVVELTEKGWSLFLNV